MGKMVFVIKKYVTRASVLAITLAIGLSIFLLSPAQTPMRCSNCNVILISIDTLGAKHLGLYGYDVPVSPFLDEISKERGIVFDNAISQAPWTLPSHAAMLTSRYPAELNIWTPIDALAKEVKTIAEVLKENGLITQAFSYGAFVQPEWGFDQGFDGFSGSLSQNDWDDVPLIFENSIEWIQENHREQFFLFIHSFHVHDPYTPSPEAVEKISATKISEVYINDIVKANVSPSGPSEEISAEFRKAYDGEIRELDEALRYFFQELDLLGLTDNTVVIFTADHGEEFGEHGTSGFHIALYNETIHVPLIMFIPGTQAQRVRTVSEIRALPPTIIDILNLNQEPFFQVESLLVGVMEEDLEKVALTTTAQKRGEVFSIIEDAYANIEQFGKTIFPKPREKEWEGLYSSSARSYRWHIILNFDGTFELYDLLSDYSEQNNLFPLWAELPSEDRREALIVLRALSADIPIPCGIYCPYQYFNEE